MNRCEPVWTALRFYVVVTFSWAKVLKSVWTGLNRFMVFFEQKPWNRVNRFERVYVFTLLYHIRLLKSLNWSEPVWTGLWFWVSPFIFWAKIHESVWTGSNRFTFLRCCDIFVGHRAKAMNGCEPVWTALRLYFVVTFLWAKVLKSVWTGFNRFLDVGSFWFFE
jgi:hypothetical protein